MTPDELLRERKRRELLDRANQASSTPSTADEALVSESTKQSLKAASNWAGVLGKRAVEVTKQGAAMAADKAKLATAAAAEKNRQAQSVAVERRLAAEQAKADAKNTTALTAAPSVEDLPAVDSIGGAIPTALAEGVVEPSTSPFAHLSPADIVRALRASHDATIDEAAAPLPPDPAINPNDSPLPEDPMGELPPLPDDAFSEEASPTSDEIGGPVRRRQLILGSVAVGVLTATLAAYGWRQSDEVANEPESVSEPIASTPAVQRQVPSEREPEEPKPAPETTSDDAELAQAEPMPESAKTAQATPEPEATTPAQKPVAAHSTEAVAPVRERSADPRPARPVSRKTSQAPAPRAVEEPRWQQRADADLDEWAKRSGLD